MPATQMEITTVRDVLGEPTSWANRLGDGLTSKSNMDGATVLDVFVSGTQLAIFTRSVAGTGVLSIFNIEDAELCARIATCLTPGLNINAAVALPIY
jgi:hypothetical protein